jgi:hypothetical protein
MVYKQAWSIKNYRYIWDVSLGIGGESESRSLVAAPWDGRSLRRGPRWREGALAAHGSSAAAHGIEGHGRGGRVGREGCFGRAHGGLGFSPEHGFVVRHSLSCGKDRCRGLAAFALHRCTAKLYPIDYFPPRSKLKLLRDVSLPRQTPPPPPTGSLCFPRHFGDWKRPK